MGQAARLEVIITPIVTPMCADWAAVDLLADPLIARLLDARVGAIVVHGSIGEFAVLTRDERSALAACADGRGAPIVHTVAVATAEAETRGAVSASSGLLPTVSRGGFDGI
jgi:dihydrodipicolinate synthase/N-acetylneuraminate lyase